MKLLLHLTILISINHVAKSWRPFNLHLTDITCFSNSSTIAYINCSIGTEISNKGALNFNLRIIDELVKPTFDVVLTIKRISQPDFVLFNTSLNACNFFENNNLMQMFKLIREEVDLYSSNFPKECPVKKNSDINVKNLYFKADNLPTYVPECKFELTFKMLHFKKEAFQTTIMGGVENKMMKRKKTLNNKNSK